LFYEMVKALFEGNMTESIPSESLPPDALLRHKKVFAEQGTDFRGRVFSTSEVASHLQSIEQTLRQIDESTATEEEKKQALHSLQPHLHVVKVFLRASHPHEQPAVGQEQPLGVDSEKTHALLSMVGQAKKALAFKQLEEALEQAQSSDDPIQTLLPAYEAVEHIAEEDPSFRPFLLEVRQLMEALRGSPGEAKRLLLPLLQRVLLKDIALGGLTPLEGSRCAAQLLFVVDHHLLSEIPGDFDSVQKILKTVVGKKIEDLALEYEKQREKMVKSGLYSPSTSKATLLPQAVATALVRPDGTLNLGVLDIMTKSPFFHPKAERDHVEKHIISVLHELQGDSKLREEVEKMEAPSGASGRGTVNALLLRPYDSSVSVSDAHVATLATLCTWWRQGNVGNCFVVSHGIQRQEAATRWLFEDVRDLLLNEGVLTRVVEGRTIRFYGAQCPKKVVMDAFVSEENASDLFDIPVVRNACRELGVTTAAEFSEGIRSLLSRSPKLTLGGIFEELRQLHHKSEDVLLRVSWIIEGPCQNLLLSQWENAIGGVHLLPPSEVSFPSHIDYSTSCFHGIAMALAVAASSVGAGDFQKVLESTATDIFRQTEGATPVPSRTFPPSLLRLRCIQIPQAIPTDEGAVLPQTKEGRQEEPLSWMVGIEENGRFIPFKDQQQFESFLRDVFVEWQAMESKKPLSNMQNSSLIGPIAQALQNQLFFQRGGVQFGALCYTFVGGKSSPLLEQVAATPSSPIPVSIDPSRAEESFLSKEGLPPEKRRETIQNVFSLVRKYGVRHGGEGMRLIASIPGHRMTLLDTSPASLGREGDPLVVREDLGREAVNGLQTPEGYTSQISELLNTSAAILARGSGGRVSQDDVLRGILTKIHDRYPPGSPQISMKEFLQEVWKILAEEYAQHVSKLLPQGFQQQFLLSCLSKLIPGYSQHFIHFADTNWVSSSGDRSEAVHGCFWFDPINEQWEIIRASERGASPSPWGSLPFSGLAEGLHVYPLTEPIREQFQQKRLLELDRKTVHTLQKIERGFSDAWYRLEQETKNLKPEELKQIYEQGTLHVDRAPPQWREAFQLCETLRSDYEKVLKRRMQEEASSGDGFRYSHLWSSNRSFQVLAGGEEQFQQAVIEEMTVPTPS
jgi:hypothetical protein